MLRDTTPRCHIIIASRRFTLLAVTPLSLHVTRYHALMSMLPLP